MGLIDADALKETIHIHHYPLRDGMNSIDNGMWTIGIYQAIDETPTVDAVEVVRCKDCKWWEYRVGTSGICKRFSLKDHTNWVSDVDFCSYGERKEVGE